MVALFVLGCRDNASPTSGPSGSSTKGATVSAQVAALADQACQCKDAPCRDQVYSRWKAIRPLRDAGDRSRMSPQEIADELANVVAEAAAAKRLYKCLEPDHSAAVMTARVEALSDRACTCARDNAACLDKVKADFHRYLDIAWLLQDDFTRADKDAVSRQMRSFEVCWQAGPTFIDSGK